MIYLNNSKVNSKFLFLWINEKDSVILTGLGLDIFLISLGKDVDIIKKYQQGLTKISCLCSYQKVIHP